MEPTTNSSLYNVKAVKKKTPIDLITYYIIPIISVIAFLGLIGLPVIGTINDINAKRAEIDLKNSEIATLDSEIGQLEELAAKAPIRQADLSKIDTVVPSEKSHVVSFVTQIESIAEKEQIEKNEQRSSESIQTEDETALLENEFSEESLELVGLIAISNSFSFKGSDEDIKDFLELLYNKPDLIIVESMLFEGPEGRLIRQAEAEAAGNVLVFDESLGDEWTIDISFAKYLFSESFESSLTVEDVGLEDLPDEDTLKLINSRY